jgi:hypothetical protein
MCPILYVKTYIYREKDKQTCTEERKQQQIHNGHNHAKDDKNTTQILST